MDILELILNNSVLIGIAYVFFENYKTDKESNKEDRQRNIELTEKFVKVSETQILVAQQNNQIIKENTAVSKEVIEVSEKMIDSLGYSENSHETIETDLKKLKEDVSILTELVKAKECTSEILTILQKIEGKIDELGKFQL